jgi:hypothetical protein
MKPIGDDLGMPKRKANGSLIWCFTHCYSIDCLQCGCMVAAQVQGFRWHSSKIST